MSKYIRVEEGVFQVGEKVIVEPNKDINATTFPNESGYYISKKNKYGGLDIRYANESEIIKESENIDDLCDEFILFDNENKIHYQSQEGAIWWLGAGLYPESVRGAIFTNEGIIYVAKYNKENGKLELI